MLLKIYPIIHHTTQRQNSNYNSFFNSWSQFSPCPCLFLSLLSLRPAISVLVSQIPCWESSEMSCSLLLVGKLSARDAFSLPASAPESSLNYLQELFSSRRILVNSGASVSVFLAPPSTSGSSVHLVTAGGSSFTCFGSRMIPLRFGSHRFDWPFQLALVALSFLGADFLWHHRLLLDVSNHRVFCPASPGSTEISLSSSALSLTSGLRATLLSTPQCISNLLSEFQISSLLMGSQPPNLDIRSDIICWLICSSGVC